jgi:hypothetical protein
MCNGKILGVFRKKELLCNVRVKSIEKMTLNDE